MHAQFLCSPMMRQQSWRSSEPLCYILKPCNLPSSNSSTTATDWQSESRTRTTGNHDRFGVGGLLWFNLAGLILPCPALPFPALRCKILPCPALLWSWHLVSMHVMSQHIQFFKYTSVSIVTSTCTRAQKRENLVEMVELVGQQQARSYLKSVTCTML